MPALLRKALPALLREVRSFSGCGSIFLGVICRSRLRGYCRRGGQRGKLHLSDEENAELVPGDCDALKLFTAAGAKFEGCQRHIDTVPAGSGNRVGGFWNCLDNVRLASVGQCELQAQFGDQRDKRRWSACSTAASPTASAPASTTAKSTRPAKSALSTTKSTLTAAEAAAPSAASAKAAWRVLRRAGRDRAGNSLRVIVQRYWAALQRELKHAPITGQSHRRREIDFRALIKVKRRHFQRVASDKKQIRTVLYAAAAPIANRKVVLGKRSAVIKRDRRRDCRRGRSRNRSAEGAKAKKSGGYKDFFHLGVLQ